MGLKNVIERHLVTNGISVLQGEVGRLGGWVVEGLRLEHPFQGDASHCIQEAVQPRSPRFPSHTGEVSVIIVPRAVQTLCAVQTKNKCIVRRSRIYQTKHTNINKVRVHFIPTLRSFLIEMGKNGEKEAAIPYSKLFYCPSSIYAILHANFLFILIHLTII